MVPCYTGFVSGFRANVLKHQGLFTDDVAVENFKAECNHGTEVIEGLPFDVPYYSNVETQSVSLIIVCHWVIFSGAI